MSVRSGIHLPGLTPSSEVVLRPEVRSSERAENTYQRAVGVKHGLFIIELDRLVVPFQRGRPVLLCDGGVAFVLELYRFGGHGLCGGRWRGDNA